MAKKTKKSREWYEKHGFEFMIPLEEARKIVMLAGKDKGIKIIR